MIIENLMTKPTDEIKSTIESLSDMEKATLFTEIENKKKDAEDEAIRIETMKKKLEEDEASQMEKLRALGIGTYEELDSEIEKLEDSINTEIAKYIEALKEE